MTTFDDIPECDTLKPLLASDPEMPQVGKLVDGKKVLRVKPILANTIIKLVLQDAEVDERLRFKPHGRRLFVQWMAELEP